MTQVDTQLEQEEARVLPLQAELKANIPQLKVLQERIAKLTVRVARHVMAMVLLSGWVVVRKGLAWLRTS